MRLLWLLLAVPGASASPLLFAVAPDLPGPGPGDEGLAIYGDVGFDLGGWMLSDGEGALTIPAGTRVGPDGVVWLTGNQASWSAHGGAPALDWTGFSDGDFALANSGDGVQLLRPDGSIADAFAYGGPMAEGISGSMGYVSPGLIFRRSGDTDRVQDWMTPRMHRIGESALDRPTWDVQRVTLYASPDSSFGVLRDLITSARQRLHLHVYELRSAELADLVVAALSARPGLDVQVAVQESPVGITTPERHATADALRRIEGAGGDVHLLGQGRYDDHHLKVLVADDAVAVQSENWVPSGVPQDPSWGNRGWGAVVHDARAAAWFAAWMADDRAAWDARPFDLASYDPLFSPPARTATRIGEYGPIVPPREVGPVRVTPIVSPDHTADPALDPVCVLLAGATREVRAQQLDLSIGAKNSLGWNGEDCLLGGLARAANAGMNVRVLASRPFAQDDADVAEALAWLAQHAPTSAGATLDRPGIATLHNKGLVVDDVVVVGSMNGNHHSRSENREAGLLMESADAAAYFAELFDGDWAGESETARDLGTPLDDLRGIPAPVPTLFVVSLVAWAIRRR